MGNQLVRTLLQSVTIKMARCIVIRLNRMVILRSGTVYKQMTKITKVLSQNYTNLLQKIPSNERAAKLLDLLMTRTVAGFKKFVDVLEVTGHHFLSDCLREAGEFKKHVDRRWCLHAVHAGHQ